MKPKIMALGLIILCIPINVMGYFISTPLLEGQSNSGHMFDIIANNPMFINGFDIQTSDSNVNVSVRIYKLNTFGSFIGHENNPNDWILIQQETVVGSGKRSYVNVGYLSNNDDLLVPKLGRQAFYIEVIGSELEYNEINNLTTGDLLTSNEDIQVYVGISNNNNFGNYSNNKPFVGRIYYSVINCDNFVMVNGMNYILCLNKKSLMKCVT